MTHIQYAWMIYAAGSIGCCVATWWLFLRAWRFVRYTAVVTMMILLATPYAIDQQTMIMAPAIYTLVFDGISLGTDAIQPLIKLMAGIWLIGIILVAVAVILTRRTAEDDDQYQVGSNQADTFNQAGSFNHTSSFNQSSRIKRYRPSEQIINNVQTAARPNLDTSGVEERQAHADFGAREIPIRALRD